VQWEAAQSLSEREAVGLRREEETSGRDAGVEYGRFGTLGAGAGQGLNRTQ